MLKLYYSIINKVIFLILPAGIVYYFFKEYQWLGILVFNVAVSVFLIGYSAPFVFFFDRLADLVKRDPDFAKELVRQTVDIQSKKKIIISAYLIMFVVGCYFAYKSLLWLLLLIHWI